MKKTIFKTFLIGFSAFFLSCEKEFENNSNSTNTDKIYNLNTLSKKPDFARDIESKNETRTFTIVDKGGTHLNFKLVSVDNATMFGKKRYLRGTVTINGKEEEARMILGENVFWIGYTNNDRNLSIQSREIIDLGDQEIFKDAERRIKSIINKPKEVALLKSKGINVATALNLLQERNLVKDNDNSDVIESALNYIIVDKTAVYEKRAKSKSSCGSSQLIPSVPQNSTNTQNANKISSLDYIVYLSREATTDADCMPYLVDSLKDISSSIKIEFKGFEQIYLKGKSLSEATIDEILNAEIALLNAQAKVSNGTAQLEKLQAYIATLNLTNLMGGSSNNVAYALLFEDNWESTSAGTVVSGLAYPDSFRNSNFAGRSSYIASDDLATSLGHEAGHNLGAVHHDVFRDIMRPVGSWWDYYHKSDANKIKIKSKFGL